MTKYVITTIHNCPSWPEKDFVYYGIRNLETDKYFAGYDSMGVDWQDFDHLYKCFDEEEARQIISDLNAADEPEECEIVYGFSYNRKHTETMTAAEAFKLIPKLYGYSFIDIYYKGKLVYTTQGLAGYAFICPNCPYEND